MNVDHLLQQTCTIYTAGSQDRFGKNSYGTGADVACRFQSTNRIMQMPNGEKAPVDGLLWLSAADGIVIGDKIDFNNTSYRVMMISPIVDGSGATRHYELSMSKWSTT